MHRNKNYEWVLIFHYRDLTIRIFDPHLSILDPFATMPSEIQSSTLGSVVHSLQSATFLRFFIEIRIKNSTEFELVSFGSEVPGSIPGVDGNFYFSLHINFLLQVL